MEIHHCLDHSILQATTGELIPSPSIEYTLLDNTAASSVVGFVK